MSVKEYSLKRDGNQKVSADFRVREFRCKDGSDKILLVAGDGENYPVRPGLFRKTGDDQFGLPDSSVQ